MGFYDTACLITGVNVTSVDATAVLLRRDPEGYYYPISLGVQGAYDGYGSLDTITASYRNAALTSFFSNAFRSGRFHAHDYTHAGDPLWFDPDIAIESLLYLIERTTTCSNLYGGIYPPCTVLDGDAVVMAMIAQPVWDAIADARHPGRRNLAPMAFGAGLPTAAEIYGPGLHGLQDPLRQLAVISHFIATHPPLRWAPPGEPAQRYPRGAGRQFSAEDNRQFVDEARRDYRGSSVIQRALDIYVQAVD
ncbi:hypothetical protein [Mycolicibacterium palauense]|uniref:hypothetical protein n=1 Tax=Mycolicibacterium palauense TaxID=2034511 RepID=UPI000BFEF917|nr:hypothetical protein [Mycolicibacterium palauense]